jgi:hypothetical protein
MNSFSNAQILTKYLPDIITHVRIHKEINLKYIGHITITHVKWVPCYHGMAHPQAADGGKSSGYKG